MVGIICGLATVNGVFLGKAMAVGIEFVGGGGRYRGDISAVMEALERQATAFDPSRAVKFTDIM